MNTKGVSPFITFPNPSNNTCDNLAVCPRALSRGPRLQEDHIIMTTPVRITLLVLAVLAAPAMADPLLVAPDYDYGDAPDSYQTLSISNGANHQIIPGVFMGALVDAEPDGQPSFMAVLDDAVGVPDDEDGVIFTSKLWPGLAAHVTISASGPGLLNAWLDFNANGTWADPGEQIFIDQPLVAGPNPLSFSVPIGASFADTYARFRFSSQAGLPWYGPAPDGEVEDYYVELPEPATMSVLAIGGVVALRRRRA